MKIRPLAVIAALAMAPAFGIGDEVEREPVAIGPVTYQVPSDWNRQQARRSFRVAQWAIPTAKGDTRAPEIYFSFLSGDGGGVDANIDRWIGQFASKKSKPERDKFEAAGVKFYTVDVQGTYKESMGGPFAGGKVTPRKNYRMLGAVIVIPDQDGVYFVRMTGPEKSVGAQVENFRHMLESVESEK